MGADVLLVSFEPAHLVREIAREWESRWPVLVDEERTLYGAYRLGRASAARVWLSPATLLYYARSALRGRFLRRPSTDARQLGGDFVIDRFGLIRYAHRSREPADRPTVAHLLKVLAAVA